MGSTITFIRVGDDEARIYDAEGDYVGDLFRHPDILHPGSSYFVIHLDEDPRGPVRVHRPLAHPRGGRGASPLTPTLVVVMPAGTTETRAVRGEMEFPARRRCPSFHACSLQQPCGSSSRCAPSGLPQDLLRPAVKMPDREVGSRELSSAECVAHRPLGAGPARRPGASSS